MGLFLLGFFDCAFTVNRKEQKNRQKSALSKIFILISPDWTECISGNLTRLVISK